MIEPTEHCVAYAGPARGIARVADVYLPATACGASVVLVHGGGWLIGSRRMQPIRLIASRLVAAGIATCAIDYRMIFRGGRLADATADVTDAVAWWRARAPDPARISLVGLSAGATLSLLAAARTPVHRLACCFGVYALEELPGVMTRLLVGATDPASFRVHPAAPTLLLHGRDDRLVPAQQAEALAAERRQRGLPTQLVIYPGARHGFFRAPGSPAAIAGIEALIEHVSCEGA